MNQAPVREHDTGIPYVEPDNEEPKTNPRIRVQLLLQQEPTGMARLRARVQHAQRTLSRLKLAPAVVLGAVLGSAPYLVEQHVRARTADQASSVAQPVTVTQSQETSQLPAATPPAPAPQVKAPAPLPPPSADEYTEEDLVSVKLRSPRAALERALFTQAKRQLRDGDGLGAQLVLQRLAKRVPHGKLMRQRRLLEIQVLQAIGAQAAARRAASEFAKAYPRSRELSKLSGLLLGS
jgi:hypothetical protein